MCYMSQRLRFLRLVLVPLGLIRDESLARRVRPSTMKNTSRTNRPVASDVIVFALCLHTGTFEFMYETLQTEYYLSKNTLETY
jgi:hypothetical protein